MQIQGGHRIIVRLNSEVGCSKGGQLYPRVISVSGFRVRQFDRAFLIQRKSCVFVRPNW